MKGFIAVLFVCFAAVAADAPGNSLATDDKVIYVRLKRAEFELLTQFKLLSQLADEHARKAEDPTIAPQPKAEWEKQLSQELRDKAAAVSKQLVSATKEVFDFEQKRSIPPAGDFVPGVAGSTNGLGPAEVAYVSLLNDRLAKVQQELTGANQAGSDLSIELQTNNVPEAMASISFRAELNRRQLWELEREQTDLELRKLEFRTRRTTVSAP
jgi:hypothetical protein